MREAKRRESDSEESGAGTATEKAALESYAVGYAAAEREARPEQEEGPSEDRYAREEHHAEV